MARRRRPLQRVLAMPPWPVVIRSIGLARMKTNHGLVNWHLVGFETRAALT